MTTTPHSRASYGKLQKTLEQAIFANKPEKVRDALEQGAQPRGLVWASMRNNNAMYPIMDMLWMAGARFSQEEVKKLGLLVNPADAKWHEQLHVQEAHFYSALKTAHHLYGLISGEIVPTPASIQHDYGIRFDLARHQQAVLDNPLTNEKGEHQLSRTLTHLEKVKPEAFADRVRTEQQAGSVLSK